MKGYFDELKRSMLHLSKHPDTIFLGQSVSIKGTAMFNTLEGISDYDRIELPVFEDTQMGMTNGLALAGKIPVSIFPRWNFFLLATNQLVNHLDKIPDMSDYKPRAIIRTGIGSESPMHPGHQHIGDYTKAYQAMLKNVEVIRLDRTEDIFPAYDKALNREDGKTTLLVEWSDAYDEDWEIPKERL
jgi:pyruvate/2-oxoglutarate/acetoin dehydrogenase E1 component